MREKGVYSIHLEAEGESPQEVEERCDKFERLGMMKESNQISYASATTIVAKEER